MTLPGGRPRRVLALNPTSRGFGFALFESPTTLIDWGVKSTRQDKEANTLAKVTQLLRHYRPEVVVLEDYSGDESRRCCRIDQLLDSLHRLADRERVKTVGVSKSQVRMVFSTFGAGTRHQIAQVIAQQLPELAPQLPRHRKPWMSEDYRMAIFCAAALALTYYYLPARRARHPPARGTL